MNTLAGHVVLRVARFGLTNSTTLLYLTRWGIAWVVLSPHCTLTIEYRAVPLCVYIRYDVARLLGNSIVMKTIDFIRGQYDRINGGDRGRGHCASVFAKNNCIYSFGYHFPLFFKLDSGMWVVNTRPYSVTTRRHQSYCYYADIRVDMLQEFRYSSDIDATQQVLESLRAQLDCIRAKMGEKKRQNTSIYRDLLRQETDTLAFIGIITTHV